MDPESTAGAAHLIEHRIPDVVSTAGLPLALAAEIDFLAGRVDGWLEVSSEVSAGLAARSLAFAGRRREAEDALAKVDLQTADANETAAAVWAVSRVGGAMVDPLLSWLESMEADFVTSPVPVGPTRLFTGVLRAVAGDLAAAAADLADAVLVGDARAPIWGALARLELGRVLRTAAAVPLDDFGAANPVLTAARTFFAAGGYRALLERVDVECSEVIATLRIGAPCRVGFGAHAVVDMRSSKGLLALHHVISNSQRVVTAAELAVVLDGGDAEQLAMVMPEAWHRVVAHGDDSMGQVDVDAAEDLSAALRRVFFDDSTRSRISKLIRRTIAKVESACPPLGQHLAASVQTGHGCAYRPAGPMVVWQLGSVA
jgi:hypothetical protein